MGTLQAAFGSLEQYRAEEKAGLLLHLPVPLGARVWRVRNNPACHKYVRETELYLFGRVVTPPLVIEGASFALSMLDEWGKTVFATEDECKRRVEALLSQDAWQSGREARQVGCSE